MNQWTKHPLREHQKGQKCKVGFASAYIIFFTIFLSHYSLTDLILSKIDAPGSVTILVSQAGDFQFSSSPQCPGAAAKWRLGPFQTYPFPIRAPGSRFKPNYTLLSIDPHESTIHVRSLQCSGISPSTATPCFSCQNAGYLVERVEDHARKSPINLDRASMSHRQLELRLEGVEKSLRKEKLLVCVLSLF